MISIEEYNNAETLAIAAFSSLYQDNKWGNHPEEQSELVWVKELKGLQVLLNRFQCDRFKSYILELGGLSKDDLEAFNLAKNDVVAIQRSYYPELESVVPVETILSAFLIYRKIKAARPNAKSILEIGPGAGINSSFFSRDEAIEFYTQVEATQATYLSQAMINERCYGSSVCEMASALGPIPEDKDRCCHVPWWRVNEIYNMTVRYDVITANACLNEISNSMLDRYLGIFATKSHSDTLLLLQDLGGFMFRTDLELKKRLEDAGWFLVCETRNWDIESILSATGGTIYHGDAVTTWWLMRNPDGTIERPVPRFVDNLSLLRLDWLEFKDPNSGQTWTREDLAKIDGCIQ